MKWVRIIWYIVFLIASIWVIRNIIIGRFEWLDLLLIAFLMSFMPFRVPSDFNIFKKK